MSNENISVIVPVYNTAEYLPRTIESLIEQTYKHITIILVDDGSTDGSGRICDEYAKVNEKIKVIHQNNSGMGEARYQGYLAANKDNWISFIDSDDIIAPNMYERMMDYAYDSDVVVTSIRDILSNELSFFEFENNEEKPIYYSGSDALFNMYCCSNGRFLPGSICGMLLRGSLLSKELPIIEKYRNVIPQNFLNDCFISPRIIYESEKVVYMKNNYYLHRIHRKADSRSLIPNDLAYEFPYVQENVLKYLLEHDRLVEYKYQLIRLYLTILKLWYQVISYENNSRKKIETIEQIEDLYNKYYSDLTSLKCNSVSEKVTLCVILMWKKHKKFWKFIIGDVKFKLLYRIGR